MQGAGGSNESGNGEVMNLTLRMKPLRTGRRILRTKRTTCTRLCRGQGDAIVEWEENLVEEENELHQDGVMLKKSESLWAQGEVIGFDFDAANEAIAEWEDKFPNKQNELHQDGIILTKSESLCGRRGR